MANSRLSGCVILLGLLSSASTALGQADRLPKRLVADYGYWSRTQTPLYGAAQIPFHKMTHLNHAGVSFNADGSLSVPGGFLEPEPIFPDRENSRRPRHADRESVDLHPAARL